MLDVMSHFLAQLLHALLCQALSSKDLKHITQSLIPLSVLELVECRLVDNISLHKLKALVDLLKSRVIGHRHTFCVGCQLLGSIFGIQDDVPQLFDFLVLRWPLHELVIEHRQLVDRLHVLLSN